jgi:hypothetical protein
MSLDAQGGAAALIISRQALMEPPAPPNLDEFTAPLRRPGQQFQAFIASPGRSTWVVCLVYGPDNEEVLAIRDQLLGAGAEIFRGRADSPDVPA